MHDNEPVDNIYVGQWVIVVSEKEKPREEREDEYIEIQGTIALTPAGLQLPQREKFKATGTPFQVKAINLPFFACESSNGTTIVINTSEYNLIKANKAYVNYIKKVSRRGEGE